MLDVHAVFMGLLTRLRAQVKHLFGGGEDGTEAPADREDDEEPRLDPANVTEDRVETGDDPVAALQEVQQHPATNEDDEGCSHDSNE